MPDNPTTRPGDYVQLVALYDEHSDLKPGTCGRVRYVDSTGTVHVAWEPNGHQLGLLPEYDEWTVVHPRWAPTPLIRVVPKGWSQLVDKLMDDYGKYDTPEVVLRAVADAIDTFRADYDRNPDPNDSVEFDYVHDVAAERLA